MRSILLLLFLTTVSAKIIPGANHAFFPSQIPRARYNIDVILVLDNLVNKTLPYQITAPIKNARRRLEGVILTNIPKSYNYTKPCRGDAMMAFANATKIDDLLIFIIPSSTSSFANGGPCIITRDGFARVGSVGVNLNFFESLRMPPFNENNIKFFEDVLVHEFLHVIGIGTLWFDFVDPKRPLIPKRYNGTNGLNAFRNNLRGSGDLLLENDFGDVGSHFDECAYDNEIMSPVISYGNYLSTLTCGALQDLKHVVNMTKCDPVWKLPRKVACSPDGYRYLKEEDGSLRGDVLLDYVID